jgi:hypothetical protein
MALESLVAFVTGLRRLAENTRNARGCGKELGCPRRLMDQDRVVRLKAKGVRLA